MFLFETVFYLLIQNKVNSYMACQGKARQKPVKKLLAYAARLLTMRVEVQSHITELSFPITVKVASAFAVFLYRNIPQGLFLICGVVLRRSIWIFTVQTIFTRTSAAAGKPELDLYGQAFYSCSRLFA